MDFDKKPFVHDTINLDEIRKLLSSDSDLTALEEVSELPELPEMPKMDFSSFIMETPEPVRKGEEEPFASFMKMGDPVHTSSDGNAAVCESEDLMQEAAAELPKAPSYAQEEEPVMVLSEEELAHGGSSALVTEETVVFHVPEQPALGEDEEDEMVADLPESLLQDDVDLNEVADETSEHAGVPTVEETSVSEQEADLPEQEKAKKKTSVSHELYSMLHDVVYLLAAVTLLFVFAIRLVGVKGDSMLPTLHNRDYLLLESNFLYHGEDLEYGDIVVLNVPYYEEQGDGPIVKRIIATEGDTVDIDFTTGAVYVNGVMLQETYTHTPTNYNWDGEYGMEYPAVVPENCIFVLGDNRNNSMDSRYAPIGMIDERCVLGKVLVVALPGQTVDELGNVIDPRDWGRIGLVS